MRNVSKEETLATLSIGNAFNLCPQSRWNNWDIWDLIWDISFLMLWLLNFKGAVSNVFNNTYKMFLLLYLTDLTDIGVLRNNTCLCESPIGFAKSTFSQTETTSISEWFAQSAFWYLTPLTFLRNRPSSHPN